MPEIYRVDRSSGRCTSGLRGGSGARFGAQLLGEVDFVTGKATLAPETVAANLFRIARAIDTLVADGGKESRLQREREHIVDVALHREHLDRVDDRSSNATPVHVARHSDRRNFSDGRRVLL